MKRVTVKSDCGSPASASSVLDHNVCRALSARDFPTRATVTSTWRLTIRQSHSLETGGLGRELPDLGIRFPFSPSWTDTMFFRGQQGRSEESEKRTPSSCRVL